MTIPGQTPRTDIPEVDMVNHPPHYQTSKGLEVINVIEAFTEGLSGIFAHESGTILKYMCRWHKKNGLEDLKKARWYLNDLIDRVEAIDNLKGEGK